MMPRTFSLGLVHAAAVFSLAVSADIATASEGVLMRCHGSVGQSYYPMHPIWNPESAKWSSDGMKDGHIILVRLGDEWDVQFGDAIGAHGFRSDGAKVLLLGAHEDRLMVGAFHNNYSDILAFDTKQREVIWTSNKIGPMMARAYVFVAKCD